MEITIRTLKEMREKTERSFIENSIIVHGARLDSPIPDTKSDLEMIIELNKAISILENSTMAKSVVNNVLVDGAFKELAEWLLINKRSVFIDADIPIESKKKIMNNLRYSSNFLED